MHKQRPWSIKLAYNNNNNNNNSIGYLFGLVKVGLIQYIKARGSLLMK